MISILLNLAKYYSNIFFLIHQKCGKQNKWSAPVAWYFEP